ncbi:unnamed protein product, partial [marine sediment metagenome]
NSEEVELRKLATSFDSQLNIFRTDGDVLFRERLRRLLREWSLSDEDEELKIDSVQGLLVDKAMNVIYKKLHPKIFRALHLVLTQKLELGEL